MIEMRKSNRAFRISSAAALMLVVITVTLAFKPLSLSINITPSDRIARIVANELLLQLPALSSSDTVALLAIVPSACLSCQAEIVEFTEQAQNGRVHVKPVIALLSSDSAQSMKFAKGTAVHVPFVWFDTKRQRQRLPRVKFPLRLLVNNGSVLNANNGLNAAFAFWDSSALIMARKEY